MRLLYCCHGEAKISTGRGLKVLQGGYRGGGIKQKHAIAKQNDATGKERGRLSVSQALLL